MCEIARNWFGAGWAAKFGPIIGKFVAHAVHKKIGGRLTKIYRALS